MRTWSKLCPISSLVSAALISAQVHAANPTCEEGYTSPNPDQAITEMANAGQIRAASELRDEARAAIKKIDKLDAQILKLRGKNGIWEVPEITEKRMNALTFETFLMLDDLKTVTSLFGGAFATTQRAAVRYLSAKAVVDFYNQRVAANPTLKAQIADLIAREQQELKDAAKDFIEASEDTSYLAFILDVMKNEGLVVDVNSMFGSSSRTTDYNGKVIGQQAKATPPPVMAPPPAPAEDHHESGGLESIAMPRLTAQKIAMPDVTPKDLTLPKTIAVDNTEIIKQRADALEKQFTKYFKTEPIQQLIKGAQAILGSNYTMQPPTLKDITKLRADIGPDWNTTAQIIKYKKQQRWNESILRLKLLTLGPQISEALTTWLGSVDGKYRAALRPLGRLAGLEYDAGIRRRHLGKILKILAIQNAEDQLQELRNSAGNTTYNEVGELIVSLIRFPPARPDWNKILALLSASQSQFDKALLAQYLAYQDEAIKRGDLSLLGQNSDPVGSVISAGFGTTYIVGGTAAATWVTGKVGPWAGGLMSHAAQSIYTSENMQAFLHLVHLLPGAPGAS